MQLTVQGKIGNILIYLVGLVAVILIVLVILLGRGAQAPSLTQPAVDGQIQKLETISASDEVAAIDTDLQNTNLNQIDTELRDVDNSMQLL